ncbi:MAG: tetratricopeptide repeat protein, partial [Ignavibacteria bacterium]|nr:tetratricopeptide repeat protein [Ignavibacteria bacterium]
RREGSPEVTLCARCHSRRSLISEQYVHGRPLEDTHYPSILRDDLYYDDGQIREEVYVYGSFLQSRMYLEGVVCTDCHEPHSTRVYAEGNALCFRCHKAQVFDHPGHHFHGEVTGKPECVDCHMPVTTYMVIDPRRDHSFRIPRPDLSRKIGSPEPCTACHGDRPAGWAERELERRFGVQKQRHYGEIFADARKLNPAARKELIDLFASDSAGPIVRATAISLLGQYGSEDALSVTALALKDSHPSVRASAITVLGIIPPNQRVRLLAPFLSDSVRLVRTLAARGLAGVSAGVLSADQDQHWKSVLKEYEASQILNADHPSSLLNLANLYLEMGNGTRAETYLRKALLSEPVFVPAYVNLADLYRARGKEEEALDLLRKGIRIDPSDPVINHALGLVFIRQGESDSAMVYLARSVKLGPEDSRNAYVYGVGLYSNGRSEEAIRVVESALREHPYDRDLLEFAALLMQEAGSQEKTLDFQRRLRALNPDDTSTNGVPNNDRAGGE